MSIEDDIRLVLILDLILCHSCQQNKQKLQIEDEVPKIFVILIYFICIQLKSSVVFASDHTRFDTNITFNNKGRNFVLSYSSPDFTAMGFIENHSQDIFALFENTGYETFSIENSTPRVFIDEGGRRFFVFMSRSRKFQSCIHLNVVSLRDATYYEEHDISNLIPIRLASPEEIDHSPSDFTFSTLLSFAN